MDFREASSYLDSLVNYERIGKYAYGSSYTLDNIKAVIEELGNPQTRYMTFHIAGSKGKGSTAAMLASILREAGLKTGLYTSPHLVTFRERIRINWEMISEESVCSVVERVKAAAGKRELSFFEFYTAMAFEHFAREGVEAAVIEVGLGGRLDATNVVWPEVCCITPLSMEHADKLGGTIAKIAAEKCGIIKKGCPVVSSAQPEEAGGVIRETCERMRASLYTVGREVNARFRENRRSGQQRLDIDFLGASYRDLPVPMRGRHQAENAAVAVAGAALAGRKDPRLGEWAVRKGLEKTYWPGRLQVVSEKPLIVLDGAQNAASFRALGEAVRHQWGGRKVVLLLGLSSDKDVEGVAKEAVEFADRIILTKSSNPRAAEPGTILKKLAGKENVKVSGTVREGIEIAKKEASPGDMVLVAGSFFVMGEVITALGIEKVVDKPAMLL